eukprot:scaffold306_cov241-Pinguiococcus_pyrenoidosus.AAC.4
MPLLNSSAVTPFRRRSSSRSASCDTPRPRDLMWFSAACRVCKSARTPSASGSASSLFPEALTAFSATAPRISRPASQSNSAESSASLSVISRSSLSEKGNVSSPRSRRFMVPREEALRMSLTASSTFVGAVALLSAAVAGAAVLRADALRWRSALSQEGLQCSHARRQDVSPDAAEGISIQQQALQVPKVSKLVGYVREVVVAEVEALEPEKLTEVLSEQALQMVIAQVDGSYAPRARQEGLRVEDPFELVAAQEDLHVLRIRWVGQLRRLAQAVRAEIEHREQPETLQGGHRRPDRVAAEIDVHQVHALRQRRRHACEMILGSVELRQAQHVPQRLGKAPQAIALHSQLPQGRPADLLWQLQEFIERQIEVHEALELVPCHG